MIRISVNGHTYRNNEFVRGSAVQDRIDANLIAWRHRRGCTCKTYPSSGGTLTLVYRDNSNVQQTIAFAGGGGSTATTTQSRIPE